MLQIDDCTLCQFSEELQLFVQWFTQVFFFFFFFPRIWASLCYHAIVGASQLPAFRIQEATTV